LSLVAHQPGTVSHFKKKMADAAVDEDLVKQAHGMLDLAKAGSWTALMKCLDEDGTACINMRPETRATASFIKQHGMAGNRYAAH